MKEFYEPKSDIWALTSKLPLYDVDMAMHGVVSVLCTYPLDYDSKGLPVDHTQYLSVVSTPLKMRSADVFHLFESQGAYGCKQIGTITEYHSWIV